MRTRTPLDTGCNNLPPVHTRKHDQFVKSCSESTQYGGRRLRAANWGTLYCVAAGRASADNPRSRSGLRHAPAQARPPHLSRQQAPAVNGVAQRGSHPNKEAITAPYQSDETRRSASSFTISFIIHQHHHHHCQHHHRRRHHSHRRSISARCISSKILQTDHLPHLGPNTAAVSAATAR